MKILKCIISFINKLYIFFLSQRTFFKDKSILIFVKLNNIGNNIYKFQNCTFHNTIIKIEGAGNIIENNGNVRNSNLLLVGYNNQLIIGKDVFILNMKIVIRGNNCNVIIGNKTTLGGGYMVCMGIENEIVIGEDCQIADDVSIWATDSHPIYDVEGIVYNVSKPIYIQDHVWIGNKSIILKGASIGKNSVIGMGSVVTKNIESHSLSVGNPCKKIKDISNWDRSFITV